MRTETSKRKALRFSLSGYRANRTIGQFNDIEIDICPTGAQRFKLTRLSATASKIRETYRQAQPLPALVYQSTD